MGKEEEGRGNEKLKRDGIWGMLSGGRRRNNWEWGKVIGQGLMGKRGKFTRYYQNNIV